MYVAKRGLDTRSYISRYTYRLYPCNVTFAYLLKLILDHKVMTYMYMCMTYPLASDYLELDSYGSNVEERAPFFFYFLL